MEAFLISHQCVYPCTSVRDREAPQLQSCKRLPHNGCSSLNAELRPRRLIHPWKSQKGSLLKQSTVGIPGLSFAGKQDRDGGSEVSLVSKISQKGSLFSGAILAKSGSDQPLQQSCLKLAGRYANLKRVVPSVASPDSVSLVTSQSGGHQASSTLCLDKRSAVDTAQGPEVSLKNLRADLIAEKLFDESGIVQEVPQGRERQLSGREASTSKSSKSTSSGKARGRRGKQESALPAEQSQRRKKEGRGVSHSEALRKLAEVHNGLLQSGRVEDCVKLVQAAAAEGEWSREQLDRALKGGRIAFFLALPRQARLLPAALSYIRHLSVGPKDYTCVINACARARNVDSAIEVLEIMKGRGVQASFFDFSGAISTAAKAGDYHRALGLFQRAREEGVTDVSLWNALLGACKESGQFQRGYEHFEEMKAGKERPNLTTFNTMASLAGRAGDVPAALNFYHELAASGLSPDGRTATVLFSALATNPHPSASPHDLYLELTNQGVRPDSFMWSAFFNAVQASQRQGELDLALEVYQNDVKPADAVGVLSPGDKRFVYSALLDACAKAGRVDYAFGIRNDMLKAGVPLDAYISTSLIRACGEVFQVQRALECFDAISTDPSCPAMHYGQNRPGGPLAVHNAILDVLVKADEMTKALEILEGMQASENCKPNLIAYNTVLMGCAYNKQMTRAFLVLKQLLRQGLVPNQRTFMPLIDVCGRVGKVDRAFSLLSEMKSRGLAPTRDIYTRLMDACSQSGVPEEAFGVFKQMKNDGILPSADSFAALLGACAARANSDQAFKLWRYMWENGIEPNDTCYDLLIKVCSRAGKIEEALDVFKETVRKHNAVTVGSFNSLMVALCSDGTRNVDRACRVLSLGRSMGVDPNRRSLLILIEGLARDGQVEPAYQFHKELMTREWNPDQKPYGKLVSALCVAGQVGRASRVVDYMEEHGVRLPLASLGHFVAGCARTGRLPMALEMYDQVKARALAELARLKQTGGFRWVTNYRNPLAKIPALAYEALIEGCCAAGMVARAVEIIGDIQDAGVVVNKATLAYLVNVASSYPEEPYMYAVHAQLRKQLQRHKTLYVDQSSNYAAMYKQAHVDFQDTDTYSDSGEDTEAAGVSVTSRLAEGNATSRSLPTGYELRYDDEWGYDREAADGYRVAINGEGEKGDLKAKQQSLKEKLRSRYHGDLRGNALDASSEATVEIRGVGLTDDLQDEYFSESLEVDAVTVIKKFIESGDPNEKSNAASQEPKDDSMPSSVHNNVP